MPQDMQIRPKFHKVVKEKELPNGAMEYTLKYDPELFRQGACSGIDTEVFYPPQELFDLTEEKYIREKLCGNCPIIEACLEWGAIHERYGIWGGTTPYRRKYIRRKNGWAFNEIALSNWER